jgi:hypothetical protein
LFIKNVKFLDLNYTKVTLMWTHSTLKGEAS